MSDLGEPQLDDLEPLDDGGDMGAPAPAAAPPQAAAAAMNVRMLSGMATPAFNPNASKEYYRFLFCGVLIVLGCLMPFGPDYAGAGYKSFMGGIMFLIGIGMIWSAWAGISVNKPSMKWIILGIIPAIWGVMKLLEGFGAPALSDAIAGGQIKITTGWGELFSTMFDREDAERYLKVGNTFRYFGTGKLFVALGGILSLVFFVLGVVGGAKEIKAKKEAARTQASARRRK